MRGGPLSMLIYWKGWWWFGEGEGGCLLVQKNGTIEMLVYQGVEDVSKVVTGLAEFCIHPAGFCRLHKLFQVLNALFLAANPKDRENHNLVTLTAWTNATMKDPSQNRFF